MHQLNRLYKGVVVRVGQYVFYFFFALSRFSFLTFSHPNISHFHQFCKAICGWDSDKVDIVQKIFLTFFLGLPAWSISLPVFLIFNLLRTSGPIFFGCGILHATLFYSLPTFYYTSMWWTGLVSPIVALATLNDVISEGKRK